MILTIGAPEIGSRKREAPAGAPPSNTPRAWTTRRLTDVADHSLAQPAPRPATSREDIAERIEEEIERLREKRPHLEAKINRAEHIITAHLAGRPRTQIVRVRLNAAGRCRFLVRSLTSSGAVYTVYPGDWSCSCPDYPRTSVGCKHGLACWVLWRVAQPPRSADTVTQQDDVGCHVCQGGIVYVGQEFINMKTGEIRERTLALPCERCRGTA
jgi:hypothetical protein